jgi:hypothetical protein
MTKLEELRAAHAARDDVWAAYIAGYTTWDAYVAELKKLREGYTDDRSPRG